MRGSRWPEPDDEPGKLPSWLGWVTFVALGCGLAVLVFADGALPLRIPEFSLPRFEMPQMAGREREQRPRVETQRVDVPGEEFAAGVESEAFPTDGTTVRSVAFEDCVGMMQSMTNSLSTPTIVEETPGRRVLRYKLEDGEVTLTCSRADNTMTVQMRN